MVKEVYWTNFAKKELKKIFEYYKENANQEFAETLTTNIVQETVKLKKHPLLGQEEELLTDRPQDFRYLLYKNYKIIYWINSVKNRIEISDIFDCRQNPEKLGRNK
ncbi:type II toxin-antitoxin system RelE/ParE family toxin [Pedobacter glucosidilyticus]|uniref:type II toxin-antitoxin system RelE/ParE family toxin n=1 Tax=Pedobacter glucosidilyticus TaxID=1122941 RepID=UPI000419FA87|nr:type II toxin-antitoxin system RelE/ParE family toxin [Pedobacter glucosidilyticus]